MINIRTGRINRQTYFVGTGKIHWSYSKGSTHTGSPSVSGKVDEGSIPPIEIHVKFRKIHMSNLRSCKMIWNPVGHICYVPMPVGVSLVSGRCKRTKCHEGNQHQSE